jgi:uncharacterized protein (DUF433 family)
MRARLVFFSQNKQPLVLCASEKQDGESAMSINQNLVEIDPEKLGGTPVFYGTRVPIQNLFDCLEGGESLDEFLEQFPTVTREQALAVLEESKERLLTSYESAA